MTGISTTVGTESVLSQSEIDALEHEKLCKIRCCANCEYWDVYTDDSFDGNYGLEEAECHRHPPMIPNVYGGEVEGFKMTELGIEIIRGTPLMSHQFTYGEDWCGEFSKLPKLRIEDLDTE